jgi:hypothetical protein
MKIAVGLFALVAFLVIVMSQMAAGYAGITHGLGPSWACVAIFIALFFRFTLPISIGAFYGAAVVWGWYWPLAFLFILPGLVFVLPGALKAVFSLVTSGTAKLTRATPICESR